MNRMWGWLILLLAILVVVVPMASARSDWPSAGPTAPARPLIPSNTDTPTNTPTRTATNTRTPTFTATPQPTPTPRCTFLTPDPYNYRCQDPGPYTFIPGATDTGLYDDDQVATAIPIGFTFNFYGSDYDTVNVSSNGNLQFTTSNPDPINRTLPASGMGDMIAGFWSDLYIPACYSSGCRVYYATTGAAPNRVFVVEYRSIPQILASSEPLTWEIKLFETSNDIQVVFQTMLPPQGDGREATLGIQSEWRSNAFQYSAHAGCRRVRPPGGRRRQ